jgi:hypothetical protein
MNRLILIAICVILCFLIPADIKANKSSLVQVASIDNGTISLWANKNQANGLYEDFILQGKDFKQRFPNWKNVIHDSSPPVLFLADLNEDFIKEIVVILTEGVGTEVYVTNAYVLHLTHEKKYKQATIENPLDWIKKNNIENKIAEKIGKNVAFGTIIDYRLENQNLVVHLPSQASFFDFVGEIILTYRFENGNYIVKEWEYKKN